MKNNNLVSMIASAANVIFLCVLGGLAPSPIGLAMAGGFIGALLGMYNQLLRHTSFDLDDSAALPVKVENFLYIVGRVTIAMVAGSVAFALTTVVAKDSSHLIVFLLGIAAGFSNDTLSRLAKGIELK